MITAIDLTDRTIVTECHDCLLPVGHRRRMRRPRLVYRNDVPVIVCPRCKLADQQADGAPGAPTREEIAERAAAIRAGWSADETVRRLRHDWRNEPWEAPAVGLATG